MNNSRATVQEPDISSAEVLRWRRALDAEADALDAVTLARLAAARHRALARRPRAATGLGWMAWAGSAAAAVLLSVLLVRGDDSAGVRHATPAASAEVVSSDVAVIADLEFYDWLEQQDAVL